MIFIPLKNIRRSTSLELQLKFYAVSPLCWLLDVSKGLDLLPTVVETELRQEALQFKDGHQYVAEVCQSASLGEGKTFACDGGSGDRAFYLHLNTLCGLHYYC